MMYCKKYFKHYNEGLFSSAYIQILVSRHNLMLSTIIQREICCVVETNIADSTKDLIRAECSVTT